MLEQLETKLIDLNVCCVYFESIKKLTIYGNGCIICIYGFHDGDGLEVLYFSGKGELRDAWSVMTDIYDVDDVVYDVCQYMERGIVER